jgi:hypothetical protein
VVYSPYFEAAKKEAVDWLKTQGLSQEGVCNLPLMFYVSDKTTNQTGGETFNPLPPGC